MAENYPYNIAVGQNYSVYVNVGNHLGSSAYYVLYVKLGNQTDQLPNGTLKHQALFCPCTNTGFQSQTAKTGQAS